MKGFTLIELLVVMTILGILGAIAVGSYQENKDKLSPIEEVQPIVEEVEKSDIKRVEPIG